MLFNYLKTAAIQVSGVFLLTSFTPHYKLPIQPPQNKMVDAVQMSPGGFEAVYILQELMMLAARTPVKSEGNRRTKTQRKFTPPPPPSIPIYRHKEEHEEEEQRGLKIKNTLAQQSEMSRLKCDLKGTASSHGPLTYCTRILQRYL